MKVLGNLGGSSSQQEGTLPPPTSSPVTVATADVNVRLHFIRKVYTILTINFLITVAISCAFTFITPIRKYVVSNIWLLLAASVTTIALLLVLTCIRLSYPFNIVVLYAFVLAMSCLVGITVARYYQAGAGMIVLQAFIGTAAVFLTITFYVGVTKRDFSFLGGFLAAGLLVLILFIIFNFVLSALFVKGNVSRLLSFIISVAGALLMIGYILYDTSLVINRFGPDLWLEAVLALYVDVTNLFLFFLNIFSFLQN